MSTSGYILGRKRSLGARPQGLLFANNPGEPSNNIYIPDGEEFEDFIILSDDNRGPIEFAYDRIEIKERMVNGRMRSYHIADKLIISVEWENLPSRAYSQKPSFDQASGQSLLRRRDEFNVQSGVRTINKREEYTTDGGAGGAEILRWYENNPGSFWVYLAYDKYQNFEEGNQQFERLGQYNEVVEVFFSDFNYSVEKRGQGSHDYWTISLTLEEV